MSSPIATTMAQTNSYFWYLITTAKNPLTAEILVGIVMHEASQ